MKVSDAVIIIAGVALVGTSYLIYDAIRKLFANKPSAEDIMKYGEGVLKKSGQILSDSADLSLMNDGVENIGHTLLSKDGISDLAKSWGVQFKNLFDGRPTLKERRQVLLDASVANSSAKATALHRDPLADNPDLQ